MSDELAVAFLLGPAVALVAGWLEIRKVRAEAATLNRSVGRPNGQGNLVEMCERLLAGQAGQDSRLASLESGQATQGHRLTKVEQRIDQIERQTQ